MPTIKPAAESPKPKKTITRQTSKLAIDWSALRKFRLVVVAYSSIQREHFATKDAYEADILMIASRGGQGLAEGAMFWIESWLAQGTRAIALVALFGGEVQETQAVRSYLADVARRGGLEFFAQPNLWPGHAGSLDEVADRWQQVWNGRMPMPSCFAPSQAEPAARWGLNE